jgi:hypothetical protein
VILRGGGSPKAPSFFATAIAADMTTVAATPAANPENTRAINFGMSWAPCTRRSTLDEGELRRSRACAAIDPGRMVSAFHEARADARLAAKDHLLHRARVLTGATQCRKLPLNHDNLWFAHNPDHCPTSTRRARKITNMRS